MSLNSPMSQSALSKHVDIFVSSFFVNGARNYFRKSTTDAPWINLGIMEKTNPEAFYLSRLFSGTNLIGGGAYSLGHGFIHGYLKDTEKKHIKRVIANLNALGAREIIFYHDESTRGLELALELGLDLRFTPVSFLEWLIRQVKANGHQIRRLDADAAVQLPCSWHPGDTKNKRLNELFELMGARRVKRTYDFQNRLCCGIRGYFGLSSADTAADSARSESDIHRNIEDAKQSGAHYLVTTCPCCYAALAPVAQKAGLVPIQVEGLASLALYGETLPDGLALL